MTIESQNFQCHFCLKDLPTLFGLPFKKIFWCSYFNRYICGDCSDEQYSIIPSFILKEWNFKKFPISKEAKKIISLWYDKPVIYIKCSDTLLKTSSVFRVANILKRKIHKMFDVMKCENSDAFVINVLGKHHYLALKENVYSLKDLCDINEGVFIPKLKEFYEQFEEHLHKKCHVCNYKGKRCLLCEKDELLMAYDVENVFFCNQCKNTFHRKCCSFHNCPELNPIN